MSRIFHSLGLPNLDDSATINIDGETTQTIQMARRTTADSAGNDLTIIAGGATVGATDKDGGSIILQPGISTGTGRSELRINTFPNLAASSDDNTVRVRVFYKSPLGMLTTNSTIVTFNLASGRGLSGALNYNVIVTSADDRIMRSGTVYFSAVNKGGTITSNTNHIVATTVATAGNIDVVWSTTTTTTTLNLRIEFNVTSFPTITSRQVFYSFVSFL